MSYFELNNFFSVYQYRFIKRRFTVLQLLKIYDEWTRIVFDGEQVDVIYTNFQKAFDRVPRT